MSKIATTVKSCSGLQEATNRFENLKTIQSILATLDEANVEKATALGIEIMMITSDLLLRIVQQIGQTNIQTPTLESTIAYIRSFLDARSIHLRLTLPGKLLNEWYSLSNLMSSMKNEPELRITKRKVEHLLTIAYDTAEWVQKHLTAELPIEGDRGFVDRTTVPYTNE